MIAIIKYNAGNICSVQNAINRLGYQSIVTDDHAIIQSAEKVILPGVGAAKSAMEYLKNKGLDKVILSLNQPILGICLGLQLMCKSSAEGNVKCLGIFDSEVQIFPANRKVPHMGWNNFSEIKGPLFENIEETDNVYFVHSYYANLCDQTIATCDYIIPFSAAMKKDNYYATQFHPEKSAGIGAQILLNFLKL